MPTACRLPARLLTALLLMALPVTVQAQVLGPAAGTANPGRVQDQIPQAVPNVSGESAPAELNQKLPSKAPPGAENIRFLLQDLTVEGGSVYSPARLKSFYASLIGHEVTLADIFLVAARITRLYRDDGYALSQVVIPPQRISGGHVRLKIVEGYIDHVAVKGAQDSERDLIESYVRGLAGQIPLNVHTLERDLLLINDVPGVTARSILSPSEDRPGASDLTILVTRKPYDVQLDANNYGTKFLGPYQLGASAALNSTLGHNERITGQTVYAPGAHMTPELMYYALGYMQPIGPYGTTVEVDSSYTHTDPGDSLRRFAVDGNAVFGGVTLSHPFIRSRQANLSGRLSVDTRDIHTNDNIEDTRKDRIRTLRAGGQYGFFDFLYGHQAYNSVDLQVSQGLGLFGATKSDDDSSSRPGASSTFTKLNADIERLQNLAPSFNLLLAGQGQVSRTKLLTTEQFGIGGIDYGRGYDPSEIIGDHGIAGKTELQWDNPRHIPYVDNWQAYGFYDVGETWTRDAISASDRNNSVASAGLGLRGTLQRGTSVNVILAFPLTRDVQTQADKSPRLFVGLSQRF